MSVSGVLVDTGPLVALLSERDQYHEVCVEEAKRLHGPFVTCWPVVAEAAHLLRDQPGAIQRLLTWISTLEIQVALLTEADAGGFAQILSRYSDQRFDLADVALMHLADRDGFARVFTIDQRHFAIYRTIGNQPLTIIPASL